ncbi:hypothetical protein BJY04DRAFT_131273 [Aspergillus karnatakaensis]|uniref:uncharacterized protein n=1 Tax=Aspergillus karnatakaensis TaxID=1810916 RepID=UPI003CCD0569
MHSNSWLLCACAHLHLRLHYSAAFAGYIPPIMEGIASLETSLGLLSVVTAGFGWAARYAFLVMGGGNPASGDLR